MKPDIIQGLVLPTGWSENGKITDLSISTKEESVYFVEMNSKGKELLSYVRKEVKVSGIILESENRRVVRIKDFKLINVL